MSFIPLFLFFFKTQMTTVPAIKQINRSESKTARMDSGFLSIWKTKQIKNCNRNMCSWKTSNQLKLKTSSL